MKFFKVLIITLSALLFTGCYTQLQYTSKMKRITDQEPGGGYAQKATETEDQQQAEQSTEQQSYDSGYYGDEAESVPVYYKDYAHAQQWADCGCNPYAVYNFYGNYYDPYLTLDPFYFYRWRPYHYYGQRYPYFGSRFNFSITFGWGSPYYYDPFFYDYYWYGGSPFAYNYYRYYSGYGYYNYHGSSKSTAQNVRYGPRTIGTNRTDSNVHTRSRDANVTTTRRSAVSNSSTVRSRTRTTGVTRTSSGSAVSRSRSKTVKNSGTTRSRSRGSVQQNSNRQRQNSASNRSRNVQSNDNDMRSVIIRSRTNLSNGSLTQPQNRSEIQSRLNNQRARAPKMNVLQRIEHNRPTFFNRVKKFLDNSVTRSGANYNWHVRSRSSSSSINRSSNSGHSRSRSTTVTRSRSHSSSSSSSHSRSRGSSSSRSRSGGSGSGSSSGNRGN